MNTRLQEARGTLFVEADPEHVLIRCEQDALDLVGICGGLATHKLLLHAGNLTDEFFDLKTGLAGLVLQKLANYSVQTAAVVPHEHLQQGRFSELANESNRNRHFGVFATRDEAITWLTHR